MCESNHFDMRKIISKPRVMRKFISKPRVSALQPLKLSCAYQAVNENASFTFTKKTHA